MRKINLITSWDKGVFDPHLFSIYDISTITKSHTVANVVDLISDVDLFVSIGYKEYLEAKKEEFATLEAVVNDTMHMRNLFVVPEKELQLLVEEERMAYVRRADLKVEIQFLETNAPYMLKLVDILQKINKFNSNKNERYYTPKILKKYEYIMEEK